MNSEVKAVMGLLDTLGLVRSWLVTGSLRFIVLWDEP